jgi:hypothetical protein
VPTGEQLVAELRQHAEARSVPLSHVVRQLTGDRQSPSSYVRQLLESKWPRQSTIDRIRALIDGREIPQVEGRSFGSGPRRGRVTRADRIENAREVTERVARHAAALRLSTRHPIAVERAPSDHERLISASGLIRFAREEWPEVAAEVAAYAEETERGIAEAWLSVITAGLQCLREGD